MTSIDEAHRGAFSPGTQVEVLSRFDRRWVPGFEIAAGLHDRYTLRRRSDDYVLPVAFAAHQIRVKE